MCALPLLTLPLFLSLCQACKFSSTFSSLCYRCNHMCPAVSLSARKKIAFSLCHVLSCSFMILHLSPVLPSCLFPSFTSPPPPVFSIRAGPSPALSAERAAEGLQPYGKTGGQWLSASHCPVLLHSDAGYGCGMSHTTQHAHNCIRHLGSHTTTSMYTIYTTYTRTKYSK